MPISIARMPTTLHSAEPMMNRVPLSLANSPITKTITSGAELPTADTMPRNDITVSRSLRFGVITTATMLVVLPKLVAIDHATATVTR